MISPGSRLPWTRYALSFVSTVLTGSIMVGVAMSVSVGGLSTRTLLSGILHYALVTFLPVTLIGLLVGIPMSYFLTGNARISKVLPWILAGACAGGAAAYLLGLWMPDDGLDLAMVWTAGGALIGGLAATTWWLIMIRELRQSNKHG